MVDIKATEYACVAYVVTIVAKIVHQTESNVLWISPEFV